MKLKIDYVNKQGSDVAVQNIMKKSEFTTNTNLKVNEIDKQQNNFRAKLEEKRKKMALNASDMMGEIDNIVNLKILIISI